MRHGRRPTTARTAVTPVAALVTALATVLATGGCAQVRDQLDGAVDESYADQRAETEGLLETVEWGQVDGLVSVLVRNDADRVLRRADAVVTLSTADGSAGPTTVAGGCCAVVGVPPGATFGFSFYAADAAEAAVVDLQVVYRDQRWGDAGSSGSGTATATPVGLVPNAWGSVVQTDVTTHGVPVDVAVVQAVVDGPDGRLATVVSGTWTCFVPGPPRRVDLQAWTPLPAGSTVRSTTVLAQSETDVGGDANAAVGCDRETATGSTGSTGTP
ncbi:hypothetical protein [Nocardioides litoris]|uniref:hypothetical protein n=1 Tax=Nocardioides litoris TaxID=1926648 RepID=UPI0011234294|nr:hypothetical protein [Nocardioides litoris]